MPYLAQKDFPTFWDSSQGMNLADSSESSPVGALTNLTYDNFLNDGDGHLPNLSAYRLSENTYSNDSLENFSTYMGVDGGVAASEPYFLQSWITCTDYQTSDPGSAWAIYPDSPTQPSYVTQFSNPIPTEWKDANIAAGPERVDFVPTLAEEVRQAPGPMKVVMASQPVNESLPGESQTIPPTSRPRANRRTPQFQCHHCPLTFKRNADRIRHASSKHQNTAGTYLCHVPGCRKGQGVGYSRRDKRQEHLWKAHADMGYQKRV